MVNMGMVYYSGMLPIRLRYLRFWWPRHWVRTSADHNQNDQLWNHCWRLQLASPLWLIVKMPGIWAPNMPDMIIGSLDVSYSDKADEVLWCVEWELIQDVNTYQPVGFDMTVWVNWAVLNRQYFCIVDGWFFKLHQSMVDGFTISRYFRYLK